MAQQTYRIIAYRAPDGLAVDSVSGVSEQEVVWAVSRLSLNGFLRIEPDNGGGLETRQPWAAEAGVAAGADESRPAHSTFLAPEPAR